MFGGGGGSSLTTYELHNRIEMIIDSSSSAAWTGAA